MVGLNSDTTSAGHVSSEMSQAATALTAIQVTASMAERTTVVGNEQAKTSATLVVSALQRISNAVVKDGNNVHSVAKEFAAVDQKMKQQFDAFSILSSPLERGKK